MFAAARQRLSSLVRKREIERIVYFHTDHFEPWRKFSGRNAVSQENIEDLERFAAAISGIEYARRLTLFYKPNLNFALRGGSDLVFATPDDKIGFVRRSPQVDAECRAALTPLLEWTGCEFQLHVHHENYTSNATVTASGSGIGAYLSSIEGAAHDSSRLELAIRENLAMLSREVGRPVDRWFFVHGNWALNASDDAECRIVDEIEILHRLGCRGDFTFPAGRPHVNPCHERPYLCRPVSTPKGYDTVEAEPEPLAGAGEARGRDRFFIWASRIDHDATSIDYYSTFVRNRGQNPLKAAERIVEQSYVHAGTLYVKTHAHSMHPEYFNGLATVVVPHAYAPTRDMLELLFDAGCDSGAEIEFATASEVYDRLLLSDVRDTHDMRIELTKPDEVNVPSWQKRAKRLAHRFMGSH